MAGKNTYQATVVFTRDYSSDADVIGSHHPTDAELIEQLRKELQQAADENMVGGLFQITGIVFVPD